MLCSSSDAQREQDRRGLWLQEIVLFALNTGMRQDEILSLEWPNADLFRKTILVVKSKNGEKRTIPMNQKVFELLKAKAREKQK